MDDRLLRGVEAFNTADFFDAHEIWESLWDESVGEERVLLQAFVQVAAGYLKAASDIPAGARRLLTRGVETMRAFLPEGLGLDLQGFAAAVEADIARLSAAGGPQPVQPPRLAWSSAGKRTRAT